MSILDDSDFNDFLQSYLAAALWSSVSDDGDGITDEHEIEDIHENTLEYLTAVCVVFWIENSYYIEAEPNPPTCSDGSSPAAMAGHDFWLTSAGHGAGFWDGDWPKYGDLLTKKCENSEISLIVGDDGKIHH